MKDDFLSLSQAGLGAYSMISIEELSQPSRFRLQGLQGGMFKNDDDSDDDKFQRATDGSIPFMQLSNKSSTSSVTSAER